MKDNMKKIYLFLLAAAGIFAAASCAVEEMTAPVEENGTGEVTTLTFAFDATKTALVNGKTTWTAGDKIRVYNSTGTFSQDIEVPEEGAGKAEFTADVNMADTLFYAAYPASAVKSFADGKITLSLATNPDGRFASANLCVAMTKGTNLQFHNATAVLKINVNSGNAVDMIQINAKNAIVGNYTVGFGADTLNFATTSESKSATIAVGGIDGDYFMPVIPGVYAKEFSITAFRGNGGYQTRTTTVDNEVKINTICDLGAIGQNLSDGLPGKGTIDDPFVITKFAEWNAFASSINLGKTFSGEYVSLETDITGDNVVDTPIGYYITEDEQFYFAGYLKGNNHKVTVNIAKTDDDKDMKNYVGLFGLLRSPASIYDLTVEGTVTSTGDYVGGVAGRVNATAGLDTARFVNVINKVTVSGKNYVGGIVGYASCKENNKLVFDNCKNTADVTAKELCAGGIVGSSADDNKFTRDIKNCSNEGKVKANSNSAGIIGRSYFTTVQDCSNAGEINADGPNSGFHGYSGGWKYLGNYDRGVGGIVGFAQNSTVASCNNTAEIKGMMHVGGVVGVIYWTNVRNCKNTAAISGVASGYNIQNLKNLSMVGGVVGFGAGHASIYDSENTGAVSAVGGLVGGVVGFIEGASPSYNSASDRCYVNGCKNTGAISGSDQGIGGVAGGICAQQFWPTVYVDNCENTGKVTNTGNAAGGIVGLAYNNNTSNDLHIFGCKNSGDVEAAIWAGGILGQGYARANNLSLTQWTMAIRNCENTGSIMGTRNDKDGGEVCGGIAGFVGTGDYRPGSLGVTNCLNRGPVYYKEIAHVAVYCGGIVGRYRGGTIANSANHAYVGPLGGVDNKGTGADKRLGALVGSLEDNAEVKNAYYLETTCTQAVGTAGKQIADPVASIVGSYNATGVLASEVTISGTSTTNVVEALNLYIGTSTAYTPWKWDNAPLFNK